MRIHFLGANRQVTGSRYVVESDTAAVMIDCGMFQERSFLSRNWEASAYPSDRLDALLLTHAHLDHCGLIPRFVQKGYSGPILATPPTRDLARVVLEDAARLQKEDAEYKRKRHRREGREGPYPPAALYLPEDVSRAISQFRLVEFNADIPIADGMTVRFLEAGHILGAAILQLRVKESGKEQVIVFSGDIGQWHEPLTVDPTFLDRADYVIMESTYGDRTHVEDEDIPGRLRDVIVDTVNRGGNIIIPTFAIDRAQDLLYYIGHLVRAGTIARISIFLDSPMAINATTIYKEHEAYLDDEARHALRSGDHPFHYPGLHFARSVRESQAINSIRGSCIILAGSGMCTGGRIKHHLRQNISRPESTILFVGYQAEHTLGREIVRGNEEVRIHGRQYTVHADIQQIQGMSAHADRSGLLKWVSHFNPTPQRVFLTHGEVRAAESLQAHLSAEIGASVHIPEYGEVVEL